MSIEDAIYSRLSGHAGLSALVGSRIYPLLAPQDVTNPFVTYQRISGTPESLLTADTDVNRTRWQITCFAEDYQGAVGAAAQVKSAMQRWQGTEVSITVEDSFLESEVDFFENDTELFQITIDFEILHRS